MAGSAGLLMVALLGQGLEAAGSTDLRGEPAHGAGADSSSYSAVILADGPVIYWRLGEGGGQRAVDYSGSHRNGSYLGSPKLGVHGAIIGDPDTAMMLHGMPDTVQWAPRKQSYAGPFSVEAWVRPAAEGEEPFFSTRWHLDYSFDVKLSQAWGPGIRVDIGDGGQWFVTQTIPFDWQAHETYFVVAVATASEVIVYVDGAAIGALPYACGADCAPPLLYGHSHRVQVGQNASYAESFHGRVDEVAVYQYALSDAQAAAHYAAGQ